MWCRLLPCLQGIWISYVVVIIAYYGTAICGYAAFGATVSSGGLGGGGWQGCMGSKGGRPLGAREAAAESGRPATIYELGGIVAPCFLRSLQATQASQLLSLPSQMCCSTSKSRRG